MSMFIRTRHVAPTTTPEHCVGRVDASVNAADRGIRRRREEAIIAQGYRWHLSAGIVVGQGCAAERNIVSAEEVIEDCGCRLTEGGMPGDMITNCGARRLNRPRRLSHSSASRPPRERWTLSSLPCENHQEADLRAILGPGAERVISSGDQYADQELRGPPLVVSLRFRPARRPSCRPVRCGSLGRGTFCGTRRHSPSRPGDRNAVAEARGRRIP